MWSIAGVLVRASECRPVALLSALRTVMTGERERYSRFFRYVAARSVHSTFATMWPSWIERSLTQPAAGAWTPSSVWCS